MLRSTCSSLLKEKSAIKLPKSVCCHHGHAANRHQERHFMSSLNGNQNSNDNNESDNRQDQNILLSTFFPSLFQLFPLSQSIPYSLVPSYSLSPPMSSSSPCNPIETTEQELASNDRSSIWEGLFENGLLWAAPKKKVTRRTIRIRLNAQVKKPLSNLNYCVVCESVKILHHVCFNCLKQAVVDKIVETGDEFKGLPDDPLRHRIRRIFKARGFNNTVDGHNIRQAMIRSKVTK